MYFIFTHRPWVNEWTNEWISFYLDTIAVTLFRFSTFVVLADFVNGTNVSCQLRIVSRTIEPDQATVHLFFL